MTYLILFAACKQNATEEVAQQEDVIQKEEVNKVTQGAELINGEFEEAQIEIQQTLEAMKESVRVGDIEKLISFHAYGPKFTEFKNGEPRNGSEVNETYERGVFGSVTEIEKMDMNDLKIAVYGDVAIVTYHADYDLKFEEYLVEFNDQVSLIFVNTDDGWKIVHEHRSPLKKKYSGRILKGSVNTHNTTPK